VSVVLKKRGIAMKKTVYLLGLLALALPTTENCSSYNQFEATDRDAPAPEKTNNDRFNLCCGTARRIRSILIKMRKETSEGDILKINEQLDNVNKMEERNHRKDIVPLKATLHQDHTSTITSCYEALIELEHQHIDYYQSLPN
jgi:hypothetical protein